MNNDVKNIAIGAGGALVLGSLAMVGASINATTYEKIDEGNFYENTTLPEQIEKTIFNVAETKKRISECELLIDELNGKLIEAEKKGVIID